MKRKRPHELSAVYDEDEDSDFVPRAIELEGSDKESHDSAGNKEINDVSKSSKDLWESDLWSEVAHSITEHLHYNQVFPGSSPRKFDYTHKDILMQHYNLHPAKCSTTMCHSKNIEEFTSANSIGHCELTILSINQNLAVDVVALPVLCSDNSYVFTMHRVPPHTNMEINQGQVLPDNLPGEELHWVPSRSNSGPTWYLQICRIGGTSSDIHIINLTPWLRTEGRARLSKMSQVQCFATFDSAHKSSRENKTAPGLSSGPAAGSWLQHTREQLQVSQCRRLVLPDPVPVLVLAVQRYLGEGARPAAYCYDVSLWDGVSRDTWLLSPELAQWVHRNRLRCGLWARIGRCSYRFLEKRLSSGLVCIEELELEEGHGAGQDGVTGHGEREDIPLLGGRKHYLPLWNNEDPYGGIWKEGKPAEEQLNVNVSKICSLQHLENIWRCKTALPPLLVRIMHKSRLRFFGKPDKKTDIPYQAYFEVADHSGMMSLVLWNSLCPEWFNTLQVGRIILIQQYAVKKSYSKRTLPTPGNLQVKRLPSLEISLNARDPPASINIIKENLVKPEWRLPSVKYQFVTRADLNDLPHNKVCDVIGLVNFVGRCERKRFSDDSEDFWLYRWIQIIDGTSDIPFLLEIFATSQPEIFEKIHPLSYLVCTQMRVIREDPLDSPGAVFLTTSNESQVFISGHHKGQPYISDRKVRNFISWMKTQNEAEVKKKVMIGGYHPFPLTPATFTKYCNENKVESVLTSFGELRNVIEHLHYREHKRIAIHGVIVALRYVEYNDITRNTPDKEAHSASRV
ncbi:Hypothetical predicted protein [Pelobates cultripes]|uniref:RPA1 related single stranded DNA binding protein, X-linked n=1 Tax=Pelobates cultripes TaxID=61616 RepID=A0AAD1T328_PELCU|nr:Hypothetical predicted protein [Pelobates cultripes]